MAMHSDLIIYDFQQPVFLQDMTGYREPHQDNSWSVGIDAAPWNCNYSATKILLRNLLVFAGFLANDLHKLGALRPTIRLPKSLSLSTP
jgi:hypothetical protein